MSDLLTLEQFNALPPLSQGYAWYMQAERPGSPLPKSCPYLKLTPEYEEFSRGSFAAMLECQELEE